MKTIVIAVALLASTAGGFIGGCEYAEFRHTIAQLNEISPSNDSKYDIGTASFRWNDKMPTTDLIGKGFSNVYHEKWQYVGGKMVMLSPITVVPYKGETK